MIDTDGFRGIIKWAFVIGSFTIAFIQFVPSRLSDLVDAPAYIGYIMTFQITIMILLSILILYVVSRLNEVRRELEEEIDQSINYYISRIPQIELDDDSEDDDEGMTDGGIPEEADNNGRNSEDQLHSIKTISRTETSGMGLLLGIIVGGFIGLLISLDTVIPGGVIGSISGNELEYQLLRRKNNINILPEKSEYLYDIASSPRPREVAKILSITDPIELSELAKRVAARENNVPVNELSDRQYKSVYIALHENHISQLDQTNIIETHSQEETITKGENFEKFLSVVVDPMASLGIDPTPFRQLSEEELYLILSNSRRRKILEILTSRDSKISINELVEIIAAEEHDKSIDEISSAERKRVYIALYQTHLPKMDRMGVIHYNKKEGIIELESENDYGELSTKNDLFWSKIEFNTSILYLVVSVIALAIAIGQYLNIQYISDVSSLVWFSVYIIFMSALTLYSAVSNKW